ncbi:MAG: PEGA domain-containing protein [Acidobacteriota bacterium]
MTLFSKSLFSAGALMFAATMQVWAQGSGSGTGYLKTSVDPGRAGVFVDGKYMGPAANFKIARKYTLTVGEHEVRIVDPRYQEVTRKVSIAQGKTTTIAEKLTPVPLATPPFGKLRTDGFAKFSAVYINDKFYGHTDEFNNFAQAMLLNPGEYKIRIVPVDGGAAHEETIKIEADKLTIVKGK